MGNETKFKILSLDGGGIKGAFIASFLAEIEKLYCRSGKNLASYFDLIVGTSTGGILALGLGLGFPASRILDFYQKYGPQIFPQKPFIKKLRRLFTNVYQRAPLEHALKEVFGEKKLGESLTRLVIPSFDLQTGEVHVYKTAHHSRLRNDFKELASSVALATSAAPSYFPTYLLRNIPLVDGGIWANNPAAVAITEAQALLHQNLKDISMLSIGCTHEPLNIKPTLRGYHWALKISDLFTHAQISAANGTAQLLLGERYIRISPSVPNGTFALDDSNKIHQLVALGETEARKFSDKLIHFFQVPVSPFSPYYSLGDRSC